jgi:hypothetical protein
MPTELHLQQRFGWYEYLFSPHWPRSEKFGLVLIFIHYVHIREYRCCKLFLTACIRDAIQENVGSGDAASVTRLTGAPESLMRFRITVIRRRASSGSLRRQLVLWLLDPQLIII